MADRVAITGVGAVSALGASAAATLAGLVRGDRGIRPIGDFDASGFDCRAAARAARPDPEALGVHPRDARIMGAPALWLLQAGREAAAGAGLPAAGIAPEALGGFAAMGMVDPDVADLQGAVLKSRGGSGLDFPRFYAGAYREIHPLWPLAMLNNVGFCLAAIGLGLRGENATFSPSPDGTVTALAEAAGAVSAGRAAAVLAGGVGEAVSPWSLARAHRSMALSPAGDCRPFAPDRDGTVPGEGGGLLALESESAARARGAKPLAVLAGWGLAWDGDPAAAWARAAGAALAMAGTPDVPPYLVMAHGDGTPDGDAAESAAIRRILGAAADAVPVLSTKGALGHCGPGAPALDAVLAALVLAGGPLPPPVAAPPGRILILTRGGEGGAAALLLDAAR